MKTMSFLLALNDDGLQKSHFSSHEHVVSYDDDNAHLIYNEDQST